LREVTSHVENFKILFPLTTVENQIRVFHRTCRFGKLGCVQCFDMTTISDSDLLQGLVEAAEHAEHAEDAEGSDEERKEAIEIQGHLLKEVLKRGLLVTFGGESKWSS
jgi:hypothetical protein